MSNKIKEASQGRWLEILRKTGLGEHHLSGKHCACPICGGTDRFRFDDQRIFVINAVQGMGFRLFKSSVIFKPFLTH